MLARVLKGEVLWQLLDQSVVSGGNFLTALVLARTLDKDLYGTFSLLFLALFAINTCHASLVVYPLTLAASTSSPSGFRKVAGNALVQAILLAPFFGIFLWYTAWKLSCIKLLPVLLLAMFAWQIQETARRCLLAYRRTRAACLPDFIAYLGQGLAILAIHPSSLHAIFLIVAATSTVAALIQLAMVKASLEESFSSGHMLNAWRLGRFTLAANLLTMAALQIPSWNLELVAGRSAVAGYQSLLNLVGIANPIIFSLSNLLIPEIARASIKGVAFARTTMWRTGFRFAMLLLPGLVIFILAPRLVMAFVYSAASPYLPLAPLLRIFTVAYMLQYVSSVLGAYEGGIGRPQSYLFVQVAGTCTLFAGAVVLIRNYGIAGAVYSVLLAAVARLVVSTGIFCFMDKGTDQGTEGLALRSEA